VYRVNNSGPRTEPWGTPQNKDVVYRVNSSGPRTEPWGTPQNKGTALFLLIETYLLRMSGSR